MVAGLYTFAVESYAGDARVGVIVSDGSSYFLQTKNERGFRRPGPNADALFHNLPTQRKQR